MYRLLLLMVFLVTSMVHSVEPTIKPSVEATTNLSVEHTPQSKNSGRSICLCMIVKNETAVISRCLKSVLPIIDYWVIVDTGSTDGTQDLIRKYMAENKVEGRLYESPWVDFSHNRNEAIELAKREADYLLYLDADEFLVFEPGFKLPQLDCDYYYYYMKHETLKYCRIGLTSTKKDFKYGGVLHEAMIPPPGTTCGTLDKIHNIFTSEGARSKDPLKYQKDAAVFERELAKDPTNARNVFYLAASYRDAGMGEEAIKNYQRRVSMGGWEEEVFQSLYQIALLQTDLGLDEDTIIKSYNHAYQFRKSRVEPLYQIIQLLRQQHKYDVAYELAKVASSIPEPKDVLFVNNWMYEYGVLIEQSVCAYWLGHYDECKAICLKLLENKSLPDHIQDTVKNNLSWANRKIVEKIIAPKQEAEVEVVAG